MRRSVLQLGILAVAPFAVGVAQEQPFLDPDTRVRVTFWTPEVSGRAQPQAATVLGHDADSLYFRVANQAEPTSSPWSRVWKVEVVRGKKSRWLPGGIIGGVVGLIAGAQIGSHGKDTDRWLGWSEADCEGMKWGFAGLIVGAFTGATVGALIKTDRWEEIPLDQFRVSVVPQHDGVALGISIAF